MSVKIVDHRKRLDGYWQYLYTNNQSTAIAIKRLSGSPTYLGEL